MESNILEALKLLLVGMTTVFLVLLIIIYGGKLLILAVNKFAKEPEPVIPANSQAQAISPAVAKAIDAAVAQMSGGKAKVVDIVKL